MLLLSTKMWSIPDESGNAVFVFPDHDDKNSNQFWYVPSQVTLDVLPNKKLAFILYSYRGATSGTGGFLNFQVRVPPLSERVEKAIRRKLASDPSLKVTPEQINLTPVPADEGTVRCIGLDTNDPPRAERNSTSTGGVVFVKSVDKSEKPSLGGDNKAIFSLGLGPDGATLSEKAFQDKTTPLGVVYDLKYTAMRPALKVWAKVDYGRVYDHFSANLEAQYEFNRVGVEAGFEKLQTTGAIQVKVIKSIPGMGDDAQLAWAQDIIKAQIINDFFTPTLTPGEFKGGFAKAEDLDKVVARNTPGRIVPSGDEGGPKDGDDGPKDDDGGSDGKSDTTTGKSDTTTGKSDTTTGKSDTTTGKSDTATGTDKPGKPTTVSTTTTATADKVVDAGTGKAGAKNTMTDAPAGKSGSGTDEAADGTGKAAAEAEGSAQAGKPKDAEGTQAADTGTKPKGEDGKSGGADTPEPTPGRTGDAGSTAANTLADVSKAVVSAASGVPIISLKLKYMRQEELKTAEFTLERSEAVQRTMAPKGLIGLFLEGKSINDGDYFKAYDLNNPFFRELRVGVAAPVDFAAIGLTRAQAELHYGEENRQYQFTTRTDTAQQLDPKIYLDKSLSRTYTYDSTYRFDPASEWIGEKNEYKIPRQTAEEMVLNLDPHHHLGFLNITVLPDSTLDWTEVKAVDVHLRYDSPTWKPSTIKTFTATARTPQSWKLRLSDPNATSYRYKFVYTMADGTSRTSFPTDEYTADGVSQVIINDPYQAMRSVEFDASDIDWSKVSRILVTPRIGTKDYRQFKLDSGNENKEWLLLSSPSGDGYAWSAILYTKSGKVRHPRPEKTYQNMSAEDTYVQLREYFQEYVGT